jgi:aryl sulfotransferase
MNDVGSPDRLVYRQFVRDSRRWDNFPFRSGDIVISTATKCGTTWMQMICGLLILQTPTFAASLDRISPWLDMLTRPLDDVLSDLEGQTHRRFIKTHVPLDGLPIDDRVTYIGVGRDPRDVAMSWDNHQANQDRPALRRARDAALAGQEMPAEGPTPADRASDPKDRFWIWVDDPTPVTQAACTLDLTLHHLQTFWDVRDEPNIVLMHYDDVRGDLDGEMRGLSDRLGIPVDEQRWPTLVQAATLDAMRARADQLVPNVTEKIWHDNHEFFHRGSSGQWRDLLDPADLIRYRRRVDELATPDLVAWVHHGAPL